VDQRPDEPSGDYEYDLAHDRPGRGSEVHRAAEHVIPPPARPVEPDGDMSYDEAHDF
jgi:hypothetical protein